MYKVCLKGTVYIVYCNSEKILVLKFLLKLSGRFLGIKSIRTFHDWLALKKRNLIDGIWSYNTFYTRVCIKKYLLHLKFKCHQSS
jgi:hypothetical protein